MAPANYIMHFHQRAGLNKEQSRVGFTLVWLFSRSAERDVNISQKMGHIIYRKAASSISLTAPTFHSMLRIERLFIVLDHMLRKPGAVCQGRCWGKNSLQGKVILVTHRVRNVLKVEKVCNCWCGPNPVSLKEFSLSQDEPSGHRSERFGILVGHKTQPASTGSGWSVKGFRSAHW